MIKNGVKAELPEVNLGNLGLHNACSYYVDKDPKDYPIAFFRSIKKVKLIKDVKGYVETCIPDRPENCPKNYRVYEQWDTPQERLIDYALSLQEEHKDLTDEQINRPADFIGRKRSARWEDERRRRGLIDNPPIMQHWRNTIKERGLSL